jgi:hypothetical protein
LCTDDTIYTAGVCTDCVGDSGQGGRIGTCYSGQSTVCSGKWELIRADSTEFVNACQVQAVGTVRTTPDQTNQSYSFD